MSRKKIDVSSELTPLEGQVMEVLWTRSSATADEVRRALELASPLTDSSIRTLLRRLETKRYVGHHRDGKRFVFRALLHRPRAAAAAARRIIDTLCGGAASSLIVGLLEARMISKEELDELRTRLARDGRAGE